MNGRISKKIRKVAKKMTIHNWKDFYGEILEQPFKVRIRIGWYIMWHSKKDKAKQKRWKNRREIKKE